MRRIFNPFVLILSSILALAYAYTTWRLVHTLPGQLAMALPFLSIWSMPVLYWMNGREERHAFDDALHFFAYLSMGWLSFILVFSLLREILQGLGHFACVQCVEWFDVNGGSGVLALSLIGLGFGVFRARRGPSVKEIEIPLAVRDPRLKGMRIVQISDLHVGMMIRRPYVETVVTKTRALKPDVIVLTGDIVDGPIKDFRVHADALRELTEIAPCYYITGNHEYYADGPSWIAFFKELGMTVLDNTHVIFPFRGAPVMMAGVPDGAVKMLNKDDGPDCQKAKKKKIAGEGQPLVSIVLIHNPKLAPAAEEAGFDLQLSGHTHAGQFFPWTLITRMVHAPHFVGLSQRGKLWVYVSAGTGSWGPPVRFGTKTELTCIVIA